MKCTKRVAVALAPICCALIFIAAHGGVEFWKPCVIFGSVYLFSVFIIAFAEYESII